MDQLETEARRSKRSFKAVVNDAIRTGLDRRSRDQSIAFHVSARDLGVREGAQLDDVSALLDQVEGVQHR